MEAAALDLLQELAVISTSLDAAEADPSKAAAGLEDDNLADSIGLVQDIRRRLGNVERDLTVELGTRLGKAVGNLSDGRQFTLHKTADRTAWDHDDWKRDARRVIVQDITDHIQITEDLVDVQSGEVVALAALLYEAIAKAQEVHGAQAPKSGVLKTLGLYASDYCTSQPGSWKFTALAPTTTEETTTDA
jgi:hypothetical protein